MRDRRVTLIEIPHDGSSPASAFQTSDPDVFAAMQAGPEVMCYLVTGRTSTQAEVWRTMATFTGAWALRGYGM